MLPRDVVASARLFGPRDHPLNTSRGEEGGGRRSPAESPCVMPSGQAPYLARPLAAHATLKSHNLLCMCMCWSTHGSHRHRHDGA